MPHNIRLPRRRPGLVLPPMQMDPATMAPGGDEPVPGMPPGPPQGGPPGAMPPMQGMPSFPPGAGPSVNAGQPGMPPGPPPMSMPGPGNGPGAPPGGPQGEPPEPEPEDSVDPGVLKALVERGLLDEETAMALLDRKQGFSEATQTPSPEGTRTPGPFGTYVAASPLEHAAAGIRRFAGYRQMKNADSKQEALRRRKKQYDSDVMDWVLK